MTAKLVRLPEGMSLTIPDELAKHLGLVAGMEVRVKARPGGLELTPIVSGPTNESSDKATIVFCTAAEGTAS